MFALLDNGALAVTSQSLQITGAAKRAQGSLLGDITKSVWLTRGRGTDTASERRCLKLAVTPVIEVCMQASADY